MCQGLGPKKHDEISETDRTIALAIDNNSSISISASHIMSYSTSIVNAILLHYY